MLRAVSGVSDSVSLSQLVPDLTYDLSASLAGYLIALGAAEEVTAARSDLITPLDPSDPHIDHLTGGIKISEGHQVAAANDAPARRRKRR